ncbi:MAG: hypothetical protein SW833_26895 [Cyanobacteriota bacterium]|nr:hypothetical protein [Cyanobacteriota bacterium]
MGTQLDLFDNSQSLPKRQRVDGLTIRKGFTRSIQDKGGDRKCQAKATEALTEEVLGCTTRELYARTKAKLSDRSSLPERAQEALVVGEVVATHDLKVREVSGAQEERNEQIVDSVRCSGRKTRKLFPW